MNRPEDRYAYYRRCQQFRRNGEQCKAPAMKGEPLCYKHEQQAEKQRRRERFVLPALTDSRGVLEALRRVAQAIIEGRIEDDHAGALLNRLQNASLRLQATSTLGPKGRTLGPKGMAEWPGTRPE